MLRELRGQAGGELREQIVHDSTHVQIGQPVFVAHETAANSCPTGLHHFMFRARRWTRSETIHGLPSSPWLHFRYRKGFRTLPSPEQGALDDHPYSTRHDRVSSD